MSKQINADAGVSCPMVGMPAAGVGIAAVLPFIQFTHERGWWGGGATEAGNEAG